MGTFLGFTDSLLFKILNSLSKWSCFIWSNTSWNLWSRSLLALPGESERYEAYLILLGSKLLRLRESHHCFGLSSFCLVLNKISDINSFKFASLSFTKDTFILATISSLYQYLPFGFL